MNIYEFRVTGGSPYNGVIFICSESEVLAEIQAQKIVDNWSIKGLGTYFITNIDCHVLKEGHLLYANSGDN